MTLAWDANRESTLMGYRVFCRKASDIYHYALPAWDGETITCTLTGLDEFTQYAFVVRAYDTYGNESADSKEVYLAAEVDPAPPPADPAPPSAGPTPPPLLEPVLPPETQSEKSVAEYFCSPELIAPEDGVNDLSLTPSFTVTGCGVMPPFDQHVQTQWQIVGHADKTPIIDTISSDHLWELDAPAQFLDGNTAYLWRARFFYSSGAHSKWSAYYRFMTASTGPDRPIGISPLEGAVDQFLTPVLLTGAYQSSDAEDGHMQTQWRVIRDLDQTCVYDLTSAAHLYALGIPPLVLEENTAYTWMSRYVGTKGTLSDWSIPSRFITGDSGLDEDGNGIPDDQEVGINIDLDGNQIADTDQDNLLCVNVLEGLGQMAVCAPDDSGVIRISAMESTNLATFDSAALIPFDLPLGVVSFRLETEQVGGIARVKIHFSEPAPQTAKWVKYHATKGWQDYSVHAAFAPDRLSVEIELQDGGVGDADGVKNGIIVDPSGYGIPTNIRNPAESDSPSQAVTPSPASSDGGGGCFISILWK